MVSFIGNSKVRVALILSIFVLSAAGALIAKKEINFGNEATKRQPTPVVKSDSVRPSPSPTPTPALKPAIKSGKTATPTPSFLVTPVPTQQNTPQKIPVFLPHNNSTIYCWENNASAAQAISNGIIQKNEEYKKYFNECMAAKKSYYESCSAVCKASADLATSECARKYKGDDFSACSDEARKVFEGCLGGCQTDYSGCLTDFSVIDAMNEQIQKLCN